MTVQKKVKQNELIYFGTGLDCFEIARAAYNSEDYYHTILWMEEALRKIAKVFVNFLKLGPFPYPSKLGNFQSQWVIFISMGISMSRTKFSMLGMPRYVGKKFYLKEDPPTANYDDILEYLAFSMYKQGNLKRALKLTEELYKNGIF